MNKYTWIGAAAGVLVGAVVAFPVGLSMGGDSAEKADAPRRALPTEPPTTEPVDEFAANLGDRALKVGETRDGKDVHTTLHEVKYPYPPAEYRRPDDGNVFLGLRIEQCLDSDATDPGQSTYNGEWAAVAKSGDEYGGSGMSWNDWPEPKFPETVGTIPGRCIKGWISLQVPKDTDFTSIIWRPEGTPVAEWIASGDS